MKKIIILVRNNFINDRRVYNTAISLKECNHKVIIIALKSYRGLPTKENKIIQIHRIPIFSSIYSTQPTQILNLKEKIIKTKPYIDFIKNNRLRKILISFLNLMFFNIGSFIISIRYNPDYIWANDLDTLYVSYLASKICRSKLIYDSHEIFLEGNSYSKSTWIRRLLLTKIEKKCIIKADSVIVTTNYRKLFLEKKYNINDINVVQNCYKYKEVLNENLFRSEFKIDDEKKIFLYQGLISLRRGVITLVDSIRNVENTVLVFMGDGPDKKILYEYISKQKCSDRIFIKDAVHMNELLKYTASADVGLQLLQNSGINHYSTISNKVFEYIMAEIPIIASNFPELVGLIEKNKIGFVVDPDKPNEISNAMARIIDVKVYNEYKTNLSIIKKSYTWENEERKIIKIVESL